MKRLLTIIIAFLSLGSSLLFPVVVLANDAYGIDATQQATGGALPSTVANESTIPGVIGKVVSVALSFIGIIFFLLILYAGFTWMIARGNAESVTKAKDTMEAAAVGLVLVLAAYAISSFVFTSLGATGGGGGNAGASASPSSNPACSNGIQDQGETDLDCGGPCVFSCAEGKKCNSTKDCVDALRCDHQNSKTCVK